MGFPCIWFFDLPVKVRDVVQFYKKLRFQNKKRIDTASRKKGAFNTPHVLSAQCFIGPEQFAETGKKMNYADQK